MPESESFSRTGRRFKLEAKVLLVILAVILLAGAGWFLFGRPRTPDASGTIVDPARSASERAR
jgi:hypothetical protein